jgi:hypothetical protein
MEQLTIEIDDVKPHPRNVREGDIGAISESLKANGQYKPIVYQPSTGHILAGNHTWKAAKALGWKTIGATAFDCTDEQALRILIADNRASDLATYNDKELFDVLQELADSVEGLQGTLYDGDELDDLAYRLKGTQGFIAEGLTLGELKDNYENNDVRNLSLPYDREKIELIKQRLETVRKKMDVETFSDVVWNLVEKQYDRS